VIICVAILQSLISQLLLLKLQASQLLILKYRSQPLDFQSDMKLV
jgi:hypothetical protein